MTFEKLIYEALEKGCALTIWKNANPVAIDKLTKEAEEVGLYVHVLSGCALTRIYDEYATSYRTPTYHKDRIVYIIEVTTSTSPRERVTYWPKKDGLCTEGGMYPIPE